MMTFKRVLLREGMVRIWNSIRSEREREIDLEGLFGLFVVFPTMAPYVCVCESENQMRIIL